MQKSAQASARFAGPRVLEGLIAQERFDVASGETLAPLGAATKLTRSGALQALNTHLRTNPSARGHVGIVELEEDVA